MSYSAYLTPRKETLSDEGIEGIIDLANLTSGDSRKIEANPELFYGLTFPTSDIRRILENIHLRFQSKKASSGLFLFEGLKGSGKSHLLLLVNNLFKYPEISQRWLKSNKIKCEVPDDAIVIINKFTDNPYDSIWDLIFRTLGVEVKKGKTHPKLAELEKALGDKKLVLIFDELEQGIKVIADSALQAQNIAFLQVLSELSNRSNKVTLFASIYSDREDPGSTLKRVPRCTIQFDNTKDRCNVILHRLFENYLSFKPESIDSVISSYVQLWKKLVSIEDEDSLKIRFRETYPFTPSLMDILLKKIPSRGSFQNVRGALSFLGNLVRITHKTNDIITPADASLEDKANIIMLKDIDISGDIINRARENAEELKSTIPAATRLASTVLLYTITSLDVNKGVTRDNLIMDLLSPSFDINSFNQTLLSFQKYASYFHTDTTGDRFFFDIEEQPEAKVELRSLKYSDDHARELLIDLMKTEIFKETASSVVFSSIEQTQELLKQMDKTRLRYILAGRRLTQEERHTLYFGMEFRNLIILLEPKDDKFQLLSDRDLLKWAKRILAAKALAEGIKKASQKADYERIARGDQGYILDRIKKAGLVFISWENYGSSVNEDHVEPETILGDCSKDKVIEALSQHFFPTLTFKEHIEARLEHIKDRLVKEVDEEYKKTLGFPIPAIVRSVASAIRELCREGVIGIQHSRGNYCRRYPDITETELFNAKITAPFEEPPEIPKCPKCGQSPCICPPEPPGVCPRCGQIPCICEEPPVRCPQCGQIKCICPKKQTVTLRIPPQPDTLSLRNQIAFKLQEYTDADITKATYKLFFQKENIGDMSTLPALLRGNLSGQGDITAEITITKNGKFAKTQIEQQVESLPSIHSADYSADLILVIDTKED